MKNIRTIILVVLAAVIFVGCKKEEEKPKEEEPKLDARLVDTKWQARDYLYEGFMGGGIAYEVYDFTSTTEVDHYVKQNGNVVHSYGNYTYTLDYPEGEIIKSETSRTKFKIIDTRKMEIGKYEYLKQ